jgi:hypothetical protein
MRFSLYSTAVLAACLALCLRLGIATEPIASKKIKAAEPAGSYEPQEGDLIFQSLYRNPLVDAIEGSSGSPFSHCGILHWHKDGMWVVLEAVGPVRQTVLTSWVYQGRDQRYAVFRLKEPHRKHIPDIFKAAMVYEGRPYDIHYDPDDAAIYCSELIYKAYKTVTGKELSKLQKLGELKWQPHEAVIKKIENGNLPLERKMVTPRSLTEAPEVEQVFTNYPEPRS